MASDKELRYQVLDLKLRRGCPGWYGDSYGNCNQEPKYKYDLLKGFKKEKDAKQWCEDNITEHKTYTVVECLIDVEAVKPKPEIRITER